MQLISAPYQWVRAHGLTAAAFAAVCLVTLLIYLHGIHGPYILDDYPNLVLNKAVHIKSLDLKSLQAAATSSPAGVFGRPLAMLTFAANYLFSGTSDPAPLKLTNVILHGVTGIGVFILCLLIVPYLLPEEPQQPWKRGLVAFFAASLWILHPLFVSTVLYTVQRMTILSALVVVYSCFMYVYLRKRSLESNRGYVAMLIAAIMATLIATLCKENGALLPVFLLILEYFCFGFRLHSAAPSWVRLSFRPLLALPTVLIIGYLILQFWLAAGHAAPDAGFNIYQRVITEPRALWNYAGWLAFLNPAPLGLVHGDFHKSVSLISPPTTLLAISGWIAVAAACIAYRSDPRYRIYVFGCTWFLAGNLLVSTTIPLSLMFEHRSYLPGLGIILGLAGASSYFVEGSRLRQLVGLSMLAYLFLLLPSWLMYQRVDNWSSEGSLAIRMLKVEPESSWTWIQLAQFYNHQGDYKNALGAIQRAEQLEPHEQSHVFNEAALRCHFQPGSQLPGALSRKISMIDYNHPSSRSALWALKNFAETCARSRSNRFFTRAVLRSAASSRNAAVLEVARTSLSSLYQQGVDQKDPGSGARPANH